MTRLLAVFLVALLVGLVVSLPLKLVLGRPATGLDLSRAEIHGSVWNGSIRGARFGQVSLRRAQIHTRPWALLGGHIATDWVLADPGLRGSGQAVIDLRGDWQLVDARLVGVPARLGLQAIPGLTEAAIITVIIDRLEYRGGHCSAARGEVDAALAEDLSQEFGLLVPDLHGTLHCRDGAMVAALTGESSDMTVEAETALGSAGVGWRVGITTVNADLGHVLAYSGFNLEDGVWRRNGEMAHEG